MAQTRVPLLFGTMTIWASEKNGVRTSDLKEAQGIIDVFYKHDHKEIDTARILYMLRAQPNLSIDLKDATVDTKVTPTQPGVHSPEKLRETFQTSLKTLAPLKIRVLYLHAPDRSVPFEETVREVNELYKERLLYSSEILGLSNYAAWEVAEIVSICKANGWVQPKIYQAMYNVVVTREIEAEHVLCCRKFGLRLVVYNPLAGGFFTGRITSSEADTPPSGGRFDPSSMLGSMYRARYLKHGYFDALNYLKPIAEKYQLRLTEIALRWVQHHSILTPQDGVILGASNVAQLRQNLEDSEKGPPPEEVVKTLDKARLIVGPSAPTYWR